MAETINMPKLGFDMAEGTLIRWVKQVGENINKGDVLAEIETDKATVEVESPASGVVLQHIVDQGSIVPVNAPIAVVGNAGEKVDAPTSATPQKTEEKPIPPKPEPVADARQGAPVAQTKPTPEPAQSGAEGDGHVKASPLAKKIARDNKVDLSRVEGTGPGGRVVRKDVEAALSSGAAAKPSISTPIPPPVPVSHEDETIQLTKLRQAIARRMTESKTTVPHFYVTHEYKMDAVMAMRKRANEYLPDNEKLSVNDFVLKAVALTLRQFPNLNGSFASNNQVVRHGAVNVGVAVAVENGLLTVAHKDTDQKPLRQISNEVKTMVSRAREGKVKPEDIEGSTFSVSNLGMYDVEHFIAILNPPEAAILAVGSAREVPVVENGEIKPGWRMKATVSVDHRVSDGAEAAQFMQALAKYLEEPLRLLV
ncbi:MAG: 2-oxo acid dehydrogenase subunit E2 [Anaerolineae bacterium]|nr:2-oxo acid dehydrogenase subunit E2 [Anaerolineae bacterium]MCI0610636.1 2-oxo acid dehydrogenase subunit E2 [Anaerolineae bacterium]